MSGLPFLVALILLAPVHATQCPPDLPKAVAGCLLDENAVWVRQIKPVSAQNIVALAQAEREARLGREQRARDMLARVYDPALKAQGIATLFEFQVEREDGPDPELFESMLTRVLEVPDEGQRANVLARMAVIHIKAGLDADLARYVEAVEGAVPRNMIRLRMAQALGDVGRFEEAEIILKAILAPQQQAVGYRQFTTALLKAGNEDWAFALPNVLEDPVVRSAAQMGLIESYAAEGNAGVVTSRFEKWAQGEENVVQAQGFRRHVAMQLAGNGETEAALALVASLNDQTANDHVRAQAAVYRATTESLKAAELELGHIESPIVRVNTALAIAAHYGSAGFKQAADRMVDTALRTLPSEWSADPLARATALQRATHVLIDLGILERATETLAELDNEVRDNPAMVRIRMDWTGEPRWKLAEAWAGRGDGQKALLTLVSAKVPVNDHARIRLALAGGATDGAVQVARNIEAMGPRAHGHFMIVDHVLDQIPDVPKPEARP